MTSPDSPSLSSRAELQMAIGRLRYVVSSGDIAWLPITLPSDIKTVLDAIDRLIPRPALSEGDEGSPNWNSPAIKALRERNYERINDPRAASPLPDSPGLLKMLDEMREVGRTGCDVKKSDQLYRLADSIRSLFRVQEKEIQRLKNDLRINGLTFEQKCTLGRLAHLIVGTEDGLPIEWGKMVPAAQRLLSDNERLRATALTPEEASILEAEHEVGCRHKMVAHDAECECGADAVNEKLRSLSGETK